MLSGQFDEFNTLSGCAQIVPNYENGPFLHEILDKPDTSLVFRVSPWDVCGACRLKAYLHG